ncbi:ras-related protein Rab-24-like isoform X2 [Venturia canescens]|uniref:ras-related protein Rab-24-like isoform X2 n=1 Tax=Venturia canescens TaxID=32260 RepID=UPI001C9C831B|nr:ras-related protein Rab-24-like isoform X2 [Venturia canescens]
MTIGSAYVSKEVRVGNKKIILGVWDTAGNERYDAMTRLYYRGANAAVICYDVTEPKTLKKVKYWINELRSVEESCSIYVCALKKDLLDSESDMVKHLENVENYARGVPAKFYITSSKTGENVAELFQDIATTCVPTVKNPHTQKSGDQFITLSSDNKKSMCCYN